jgi:hypothetical protein
MKINWKKYNWNSRIVNKMRDQDELSNSIVLNVLIVDQRDSKVPPDKTIIAYTIPHAQHQKGPI